MTAYAFANGFISTLGSAMSDSTTSLTPGSTTGAPLLDPTAATPVVAALIIDFDAATGLPTADSEIVTVTDTRTVPWTVVRADETVVGGVAQGVPIAHSAGVPIAFVASAASLATLVNPNIQTLEGTSGWGSAETDYVLTIDGSGDVMAKPAQVPELAQGIVYNRTGTSDGHSAIPATTPFSTGNTVTVTDGAGNALTVTVDANTGRWAELRAAMPMIRDAVSRDDTLAHYVSGTKLNVRLALVEATAPADLTAAGLTALNFLSAFIQVPNLPSAQFQALTFGHFIDPALCTIPRTWGLAYLLVQSNDSYNANAWVQNLNTADAGGYRTGTRFYVVLH